MSSASSSATSPDAPLPVVAEHVIGLMFAAAKRAAFQTVELKAGRWTLMQNMMLQGKTIGIVGTGNVGREVARIANALGMRCLAWTFNPSPERAENMGVEFVELDQLLKESDVVSLHVRLSPDSHHIIGARELALMKSGALLINGGRGELVDDTALVEALQSGHLAGAGLDVFAQEPLPPDHPSSPAIRSSSHPTSPTRPPRASSSSTKAPSPTSSPSSKAAPTTSSRETALHPLINSAIVGLYTTVIPAKERHPVPDTGPVSRGGTQGGWHRSHTS